MIDNVEIKVLGGKGGDGAVHFRREKYKALGGPDGGKGGKGGDVYLISSGDINDLEGYKGKKVFKAQDGSDGQGNKKSGKEGEDLYISVPLGTEVYLKDEKGAFIFLTDMVEEGKVTPIAHGGKPGYGNAFYATPTRRAPDISQKGEEGDYLCLKLELKIIADVSIVGYPNAGKSTLLSLISAARPEIASYKFTTREPVVGVVEIGYERIVVAEIPGLISGAHVGKGLGFDFLKHLRRTKLLINLLDGYSENPLDDMRNVNREIEIFEPSLMEKPQIAVLNKIDLPSVRKKVRKIEEEIKQSGQEFYAISSKSGEGIDKLMEGMWDRLKKMEKIKRVEKEPFVVLKPIPRK